jgi:hypothetical protein
MALPAGSAERGALLRREGLYTSHIAEWRKARDADTASPAAELFGSTLRSAYLEICAACPESAVWGHA